MLPILANRTVQKFEIPIENADDFKLMLLAPNDESWRVKVALPNANFFDLRQDGNRRGIERTESFYGLGDEQFPAEVFSFKVVASGVLRVEINTSESPSAGFLVVSSESPYRLYSYINSLETVRGQSIGLVASLFDNRHYLK